MSVHRILEEKKKPNTNLFNKSNEEKLLGDNHKLRSREDTFSSVEPTKIRVFFITQWTMKYRVGNMNGGEISYSSSF